MDDNILASIDLSPIATVITDPRLPDNPIVAVNTAFASLTGYARGEAMGRNCRFLAGARTEPRAAQPLRDAVEARRPGFAELINYRKDGTAFLNAVMIAPRFDAAGALRYFLGSQMDVTHEADASGRRRRAAASFHALTPRQRDVLRLMAQGLRNKQIAATLGINEKTVKMHRVAMLGNLGARTTADAVRIAVEAGL